MKIKSPRKQKVGRLMHQIDMIARLCKQGVSYENIGKEIGTQSYTICHFVKNRGWTRPRVIHKDSFIPQTDLMLKLCKEEHLSTAKIAQNLTREGVYYALTRPLLAKLKQKGIYQPKYLTLKNQLKSWLFLKKKIKAFKYLLQTGE